MNRIPERYQAPAHIVTGAVFISFSGVWVAWSQVDPMVSAFYRVLFGVLFLGPVCLIKDKIQRISPKTSLLIILCGLCFAADLYCWHISIVYVGPGLATILGNFQVFALTIVSLFFFGQPIRALFLVSLPLAFTGLVLIIGISWSSLPEDYQLGVYFGLATAFFYALFILSLRKIQQIEKNISFLYTLLLVSLATSVVLALLIIISGISFKIPNLTSLGSLVGLGLFSQTIGWAYITKSLPLVMPSMAGLILLLQPSLAFFWDVLIFDRPTSALQWLGVLIVLTAIYLGMRSSHRSTDGR